MGAEEQTHGGRHALGGDAAQVLLVVAPAGGLRGDDLEGREIVHVLMRGGQHAAGGPQHRLGVAARHLDVAAGRGRGQRHRRNGDEEPHLRIDPLQPPAHRLEIGDHLVHVEIVEREDLRIERARDRAGRGRIDRAGLRMDPGLGQAEGENEEIGPAQRAAHGAQMRRAMQRHQFPRGQAVGLHPWPLGVEEPIAPPPDRQGGCRAAMGLGDQLAQLPAGVDVAVARRILPVAEALGHRPRNLGRQRLHVEHVEPRPAQRSAHVLGEAASGGHDPHLAGHGKARLVQVARVALGTFRHAGAPVGARVQAGVGRGRAHAAGRIVRCSIRFSNAPWTRRCT